jgi:hypothetical protein
LDSHSNVTITSNTNGEILRWNGTAWINNTLAEAGIQPAGSYAAASHTHVTADITNLASYTGFDSRYPILTSGGTVNGSITVKGSNRWFIINTNDNSGLYNITSSHFIIAQATGWNFYTTTTSVRLNYTYSSGTAGNGGHWISDSTSLRLYNGSGGINLSFLQSTQGATMYGNWGGASYFSAGELVSTSTVRASTYFIVEAGGGLSSTSTGVGTKAGRLLGNDNANSAYGQWSLTTTGTSAWIGFNWNIGSRQPHLMFLGGSSNPSGYGNGGLYYQTNAKWAWYWDYTNNCLGVGASTTISGYSLHVTGAIYATGDIEAFSDERGKTNIRQIDNALGKVLSMRGVYYTRLGETKYNIGVIAQEIQKIAPELVSYSKEADKYGVKYGNISALLIEAIKEQQEEIRVLKSEIERLKANK